MTPSGPASHVLTWIDGFVAVCLVVPAIRGWQGGLVAGLLRLGGLVVGGWAGWAFSPDLSRALLEWRPGLPAGLLPWLTPLLGALAGWLLGVLAGWLWRRSTKDDPLGWLDRIAGGVLGAAKGAAFALAVLTASQVAFPATRATLGHSLVASAPVAPVVDGLGRWSARVVHERKILP